MVRSNELGCRNGWDKDLWVAANTDGAEQRSQPHDRIGSRAASEVEPVEQSDLITSIVAAKTENASPSGTRPSLAPATGKPAVEEDIIVNQAPSLSWSAPSNGPISPQPATELVQNPKLAILRARDQYRQRRKQEGRLADLRLADPSGSHLASSREASLVDDNDLVSSGPESGGIDPQYENRPLLRPTTSYSFEDRRPVSPVSRQEIERQFPSMTEFPEDRVRFESVPFIEADGAAPELLDTIQDDTWIETRQVDAVLPEPYVVDDLFEEDEVAAESTQHRYEEEELSVRHRESSLNRFLRQRRERRRQEEHFDEFPLETDQPPIGIRQANPQTPTSMQQEETTWRIATEAESAHMVTATSPNHRNTDETSTSLLRSPEASRTRHDPPTYPTERSADSRGRMQQASWGEDDFVIPPPLPVYKPEEHRPPEIAPSRRHSRLEPAQDIEAIAPSRTEQHQPDEFGDQPLFASQPLPAGEDIELGASYARSERASYVSPRLERICQTCRDFRPAENGERGWCNNKWAFNHRRMVDADDLACRNSLGSWWTPKDDTWRRDGDISRHAQQTPRVDQWLLGNRENEAERRRSGS